MTRAEEITKLQLRYRLAASQHKRKTMGMILVRLSRLMTMQIKSEHRADRKELTA